MDTIKANAILFREKVVLMQFAIEAKWQQHKPAIISFLRTFISYTIWLFSRFIDGFLYIYVLLCCRAPVWVSYAVKNGTSELNKMGISTVLKDYGTDILDAIRENNLHRLQAILEKQLKGDSKIARVCITDIKHRPSKKFACPLILASRQEDPSILQWMMDKGTDPNFVHHTIYSSKRREIVTALHIAVDLGFYDNVEVLLSANADCNIGDHKQETPLHIAVKKADRVMCQMLLSKGADPTIPDSSGNAALHIATLFGHLQLVKILLKYDADIFQKGADGAIPPHIAAKEGHIHLMHLFCTRHLGNINIKIPCYSDQREKAPLHMAAENGHKEITHVLVEQYEADVNVRDSDGNTALHCCVLNPYDPHRMREKDDFYETAKVLLRNRVSVNAKNAFGDAALHLAAMNRFQRIVELLLEVGANPFIENDEKLKPIDVVPDDDPVTRQILKTAMLQGPKPINLSIETLNRDISGSFMNWTKPMVGKHSRSANSGMDKHSQGEHNRSDSLTGSSDMTRSRSSERALDNQGSGGASLDRSLSIASSQASVFAPGDDQQTGHKHPPHHQPRSTQPQRQKGSTPNATPQTQPKHAHHSQPQQQPQQQTRNNKPPLPEKPRDQSNLGRTRAVDGAAQGEGQDKKSQGQQRERGRQGQRQDEAKTKTGKEKAPKKEPASEYTEMGNVRMRNKPGRMVDAGTGGKESPDDTYSFMSSTSELSILRRDGSTQTLDGSISSRHRSTQVSRKSGHRDRIKSSNKQMQTSFISSYADTETNLSRASDLYSETSEFTEFSEEPRSRSNRGHKARRTTEDFDDDDDDDDTEQASYYTGDLDESMQSFQSTSEFGEGSRRPVRKTGKQYRIERSKQKYRKSRTSSEYSDDMEQSQVAHYAPGAAANTEPVPGSVKVHHVPGRPGTIELEYSGGPITIALDTQAFGNVPTLPKDDGEEYFFDSAGNKYPVSLITALQKASLLNKTPIVTSNTATQVQEIKDTPTKVDTGTGTGAERIYANETEISAMLDSSHATSTTLATSTSMDTTLDDTQGAASTPLKSAIAESVHALTRTPTGKPPAPLPRDSPVTESSANEERENIHRRTPTRQSNHLNKILGGKAKKGPARRGTPTMHQGQEEPKVEVRDDVISDESSHATEEIVSQEEKVYSDSSSEENEVSEEKVASKPRASNTTNKAEIVEMSPKRTPPPLPSSGPPVHRAPPTKKERKKSANKQKSEDDSSFVTSEMTEELEEAESPGYWDQSPNTPPFKSFSQKMAWAKALEQGKAPPNMAAPRGKKPRPPLTSQSEETPRRRKQRHSVIEEESEEEVVSDESQSSESESGSESEIEADDERRRSDSAGKASTSSDSAVQQLRETPSDRTEKIAVVTVDRTEQAVVRTESLEVLPKPPRFGRDNEVENEIEQYAVEPNIRTFDRVVSPSGRRGGAQTPDSICSTGSGRGGVLNLRVSGPTPKAYSKSDKEAARVAWLRAKPERIESASDASDSEFGSRYSLNASNNSLDRSLSPGGTERSRRWSEDVKPIYRKQTPTGTRLSKRPVSDPTELAYEEGEPRPAPRAKQKLLGSYAKPYKPLGDFDVKTDLIEEAAARSPFSPMSPIHTAIAEEEPSPTQIREFSADTKHFFPGSDSFLNETKQKAAKKIQKPTALSASSFQADDIKFADSTEELDIDEAESEIAGTSISERTFKRNIKISEQTPSALVTEEVEQMVTLDTELVARANEATAKSKSLKDSDLKFMDSTEELDVEEAESEKANTSISGKTFKRNIKIYEDAPEEYRPEEAQQDVAMDPALVAIADAERKRKKKEKKKKKRVTIEEVRMTDEGVMETLTTTVEYTKTEGPALAVAEIVNTSDEFLDASDSEEEEEEGEETDSEVEEYEQEPGRKKPRAKLDKREDIKTGEKENEVRDSESDEEMEEEDDIPEYDREPGARRPKTKPPPIPGSDPPPKGTSTPDPDVILAGGGGINVPRENNAETNEIEDPAWEKYQNILGGQASPAALIAEAKATGKLRRSVDEYIAEGQGQAYMELDEAAMERNRDVEIVDVFVDNNQVSATQPALTEKQSKKSKDKVKKKKKKKKDGDASYDASLDIIEFNESIQHIQPMEADDATHMGQDNDNQLEPPPHDEVPEEGSKAKKKKKKDRDPSKPKKKKKSKDIPETVANGNEDEKMDVGEYEAEPGSRKKPKPTEADRPDPMLVAQVLMNQGGEFMDDVLKQSSDIEEYDQEPGGRRKTKQRHVKFDAQPAQIMQSPEIEESMGGIEPTERKMRPSESEGTPQDDASLGFDTYNRSYDPEDEEVANINETAAERKKKKKEKKKKQEKQSRQWADEQKAAEDKKKVAPTEDPTLKELSGKTKQGQDNTEVLGEQPQVFDDKLPPGLHTQPIVEKPQVEITFENINVINDNDKVKKKKKKKDKDRDKDGKEHKKKKKKSKPEPSEVSSEASTQPSTVVVTEIEEEKDDLEEYQAEPGMRRKPRLKAESQPITVEKPEIEEEAEKDELEEYAAEPGKRRKPRPKADTGAKKPSQGSDKKATIPIQQAHSGVHSTGFDDEEPLPPSPEKEDARDDDDEEPLPSPPQSDITEDSKEYSTLTAEALAARALRDVKARQYASGGSDDSSAVGSSVVSSSIAPQSTVLSSEASASTGASMSIEQSRDLKKSISLSSATSGEELEGITTTVMGAKVERNDTVLMKGDGAQRPVVAKRKDTDDELSEEESEYSEYSEYTDDEEQGEPQQVPVGAPVVAPASAQGAPVQAPAGLHKAPHGPGAPTTGQAVEERKRQQDSKSQHRQEEPMVESTNIDDSIEETNLDDETESEYETESETGSDEYEDEEEEEPIPTQAGLAAPGEPFSRGHDARASRRHKRGQKREQPPQDADTYKHPGEKPREQQGAPLAIQNGAQWRDQDDQQKRMKEILSNYEDFENADPQTMHASRVPNQEAAQRSRVRPRDMHDPNLPPGHHPQHMDPRQQMDPRRQVDPQNQHMDPNRHMDPKNQQMDPNRHMDPRNQQMDPRQQGRVLRPYNTQQHGSPHEMSPQQRGSRSRPQGGNDPDLMAQIWAQQNPAPRGGDPRGDPRYSGQKRHPPPGEMGDRPPRKVHLPSDTRSLGAMSDTEMTSRNRRAKKHARFAEIDPHSESEMFDYEPPKPREPGKSFQDAAMESLKDSLQNQPKLTPRRPLESMQARGEQPINYTRGIYRPQAIHWRGSRGHTLPSSGRYGDSELISGTWVERQGAQSMTESEGEVDDEVAHARVDPRIYEASQHPHHPSQYPPPQQFDARGRPLPVAPPPHDPRHPHDPHHPHAHFGPPPGAPGGPRQGQGPLRTSSQRSLPQGGGTRTPGSPGGSSNGRGAFAPVAPGEPKRVKIFERQKKREARAARLTAQEKPDEPIKTEPDPVDFSKYPPTAKLWMEKVDSKTVQKSKTMYLSVMPEGLKPPPELAKAAAPRTHKSADDVFLPPQWVIARGRTLRKRKQKLDRQRQSTGSLSGAGVTSGESDGEGMDRPLSPGRQMLLFFRVGNDWKDLTWVIMDGRQTDAETTRMIKDIQLKNPHSLTDQVHDMMHRWWKKSGSTATIEELRRALDICNIPYIEEEYFNQDNKRGARSITSYHESEDDLDVSEISDVDPDVSRLVQEYELRSPNQSYDLLGGGAPNTGSSGNLQGAPGVVSVDSLVRRMEDKGVKIDRSKIDSKLSAASRDSVFTRGSSAYERYESGDSFDEYYSDGDTSRRSFLIVQPQLKQEDYNYETQI